MTKRSPSTPGPGVFCACTKPAFVRLWEVPVALCHPHAKAWLRSAEKVACDAAIEAGHDEDACAVVDAFIARVVKRDAPALTRLRWWFATKLGRTA